MGLSCGQSFARTVLIIFNIIFFLLGGAILGVGIFVLVDKKQFITLTKVDGINQVDVPSLLESGAYALIAGGGAVFLIGFLGCCGALKKVKSLLVIYAVLVGIIFVVQLVGGILGYVFKDEVESKLRGFLGDTITEKYNGKLDEKAEPFTLAWNYLMLTFSCCGVSNYTEFDNATNWNRTNYYSVNYAVVPAACCKISPIPVFPDVVPDKNAFVDITNCLKTPNNDNSNIAKGCYDTIRNEITSRSTLLLGVAAGIGVIELLGIIFACCLCRAEDDD